LSLLIVHHAENHVKIISQQQTQYLHHFVLHSSLDSIGACPINLV